MLRLFIRLALAASVLVPCAAIAGDMTPSTPAAATDTTTATTTPDDNQIICHREKLTGTLLPGPRVCKPYKIWRQQQQDSQDLINNQTIGNLHTNPKGG